MSGFEVDPKDRAVLDGSMRKMIKVLFGEEHPYLLAVDAGPPAPFVLATVEDVDDMARRLMEHPDKPKPGG